MLKRFPYPLYAFLLLISACINNTNTPKQPGATRSNLETKSEPDAIDLLDVLQGKWQSEQDSTYILDIAGNTMKHLNGGALTLESEIEVDAKCLNDACKTEGSDTSDGWCFVEKSQGTNQCNLVLKCDKEWLHFRAIGASAPLLIFKKLP